MKIDQLKQEMNNEVEGLIAKVNTVNESTTRDGQPYASLNLMDETGTLTARWWNALPETLFSGGVYRFRGVVNEYNSRLQFIVKDFELIEDPAITALYFESAPQSVEWIAEKVDEYLSFITDKDYYEVTSRLINSRREAFLSYPAATQNHHAYLQGLSYHTVTMCQVAQNLLPIYPFLNPSLVYAGILLHDIAKTEELTEAKSPEYSTEGKLIGHLVMGARWVHEVANEVGVPADKALLLEHIIIAHHGRKEWGSAQTPQIAEAEFIYFIDNLDSKMESIRVHLDEVDVGEWTKRIPVLDGRSLLKH